MNLLLCSSSGYRDTGYLTHTADFINEFLTGLATHPHSAIFIPYAGVTKTYAEYLAQVRPHFSAFDIALSSLHECANPIQAIKTAEMIIVGGGNTFALLKRLQAQHLIPEIRARITSGVPYMGWSAGSNLAGKSISTTNDMPIVEPINFQALNIVPFLINPHFISGQIPGHNGESREQRLAEYMVMNPLETVVALMEGTALLRKGNALTLIGRDAGYTFHAGKQSSLALGDCSFLLNLGKS